MRELILPLYFVMVFCLLFSLTFCTGNVLPDPPAKPIHDTLIVPGKRIGPVSLGMSAGQLLQTMGSPIFERKLADGSTIRFSGGIAAFVPYDSNRVSQVYVHSSSYATKNGLRIGTGSFKVRAVMGSPRIINDVGGSYRYHFSGIVFNFYNTPQNHKVTSITVSP